MEEKKMARLAVLLPHRDRKEFKDFQISYLPNFVKSQGIDCKIFFCEQKDDKVFNRSRCINFAFKFCMENYSPDYVVVSDIDIVPFVVDYGWHGVAEAWFMNAGGMKILSTDFEMVNGYNNNFYGWGYEDSEFWFRLDCFGVKNRRWPAPTGTEMVDMEMHEGDSKAVSLSYFGSDNPRFFHCKEKEETKCINFKPKKTWYNEKNKKRNVDILHTIRSMPQDERLKYFKSNGLNEINLRDLNVEFNDGCVAEVSHI